MKRLETKMNKTTQRISKRERERERERDDREVRNLGFEPKTECL